MTRSDNKKMRLKKDCGLYMEPPHLSLRLGMYVRAVYVCGVYVCWVYYFMFGVVCVLYVQ